MSEISPQDISSLVSQNAALQAALIDSMQALREQLDTSKKYIELLESRQRKPRAKVTPVTGEREEKIKAMLGLKTT